MTFIHLAPAWRIPKSKTTPEDLFFNRRAFIKSLAVTGGALMLPTALLSGCGGGIPSIHRKAKRNEEYTLDRPLTEESVAANHNNFYEFSIHKWETAELAQKLQTSPWSLEVCGDVERKGKYDAEEIIDMFPLEERLYRFRCVEGWAMAVPWIGFPMRDLIEWAGPQSSARYILLYSFYKPEIAEGQKLELGHTWPYREALSMEEAKNDLTLLATGIYGKPLPKQHGAPIRLVVPWKYGFKSIKSITKIEFLSTKPTTFWNELKPDIYTFSGNVDPTERGLWSQEYEHMIGTIEKRKTLPYNGYGEYLSHIYDK